MIQSTALEEKKEKAKTHPPIPRPKGAAMLRAFALDHGNQAPHALLWCDDPFDFPIDADVRHVPVDANIRVSGSF
jgi:hypothetical protein